MVRTNLEATALASFSESSFGCGLERGVIEPANPACPPALVVIAYDLLGRWWASMSALVMRRKITGLRSRTGRSSRPLSVEIIVASIVLSLGSVTGVFSMWS